ncbi:MAG TPA: DegT/DnrJ/EryC1/StrS family aminotransferase [Verrucomicrobiae bacterium]|jgi:dTDP-4-amino-4,6-dideoxygalactose transaminase|nr:DegT/DnrJ/EryC1/StrS family aminotransferase [Verrucomicrobiae bacterium]
MDHIDVPFLDLVTPHVEMEEQLVAEFRAALRTAGFIGGKPVDNFEAAFAEFCDTRYCVGVGSGTDALRFALTAAGVAPGDSVLTVANTFIATTEAITQAGAMPEFVEIDERTYNIDPRKLREHLEQNCDRDPESGRPRSRRTGQTITAIVPVHLYGQMADMDPILKLAEEYNLLVIEDACQAHGAEYFSNEQQRWRKAGSIGIAAAFSFYPGKNLGACGEAGAVTTNDPQIADMSRKLRDHGQAAKYYHDVEGYNGRLDAIQARILYAKLTHLPLWNMERRRLARHYNERLATVEGLVAPFEPQWSRAVYHLYVVRVQDRQEMQNILKGAGVATGIHYPVPLHVQQAYRALGYSNGDLPITERVSAEILSLPMYPQLNQERQAKVIKQIKECLMVPSSASR